MSHFNVSLARGLGTMTRPANTIAGDDDVEHAASATTTTDDSSADWQPGVEADSNGKLTPNAGWRMADGIAGATPQPRIQSSRTYAQYIFRVACNLKLEARISSPYFLCA